MFQTQLTGFFLAIENDVRIGPSHISIYIAIFRLWMHNGFFNPVPISRDKIMRTSKISARATYHRCMKELHNYGYIKYHPTFHPLLGSTIYLNDLSDTKPLSR